MSTPVASTREVGQTSAGVPKKLFSGGEHGFRAAALVVNRGAPSDPALKIRCVERGKAAPPNINSGQETYTIYGGDAFNLGQAGDASNDIYVWGDGGVQVNYTAEELV